VRSHADRNRCGYLCREPAGSSAPERAPDGPRAIEVARREPFDVVLLDIGLPAMDGYEVARHLRAMPGWDSTRLVAISGYGQHSDQQRSLDAGFDYHFVKPVDMSALTRALAPKRTRSSFFTERRVACHTHRVARDRHLKERAVVSSARIA
jgi:CheY-like chemotaxis protein